MDFFDGLVNWMDGFVDGLVDCWMDGFVKNL